MKQLPKGATIKLHIVMPLFHLAAAHVNREERSGEEFRKVSWGLIDMKRWFRKKGSCCSFGFCPNYLPPSPQFGQLVALLWASWSSDQAFPTAGALKPAEKRPCFARDLFETNIVFEKEDNIENHPHPCHLLSWPLFMFPGPSSVFLLFAPYLSRKSEACWWRAHFA